jgi:hypothetical protein
VSTLAIDCDFKKHYAVDDAGRVVHKADAGPWLLGPIDLYTTVLFEIASPVDYTPDGNKAIAYNKRKWTIWNVAQAMYLDACLVCPDFLVAPSSKWTKGYDLKTRHAMAKCVQKQKDLREAECMIWFYKQFPDAWIPLPQYLQNL